jgi:hypothetical protein
MAETLLAALRKAAKGLLYQSEKDEPFAAFSWRGKAALTPDLVRAKGGHSEEEPIEEMPVEDFFGDLTAEQDWHGDDEKADVEKYRRLFALLRERLSNLKVFKVGETEVTYYVAGETPDGSTAGVSTTALET